MEAKCSALLGVSRTTRAAEAVFGACSAPSDRERSIHIVPAAMSTERTLSATASDGRMPV